MPTSPAAFARPPFWRRQIYATRRSAYLVFALIMWPLATIVGSAVTLMDSPYVPVSLGTALQASVAGLILSLPDMLVAGGIFFGVVAIIFRRFGPDHRNGPFGFARLGAEPLLAFVAILGGATIFYPALPGGSPLLYPLWQLPVAAIAAMMMLVAAAGALVVARPGKRIRLAGAVVALGLLSAAPLRVRAHAERFLGSSPSVIVLGLDSVSRSDDVAPLQHWTERRGGTWYEHAVAPGLLTNAVWTSILTMAPVRSHHVFHTFERPIASPAFLEAARAQGYRTVSVFPDQLTCSVGSGSGFDDDRSGVIGWRQVLLPTIANSSFLIPLIKPVLPRVWPMAAPPNQAGTFTYDVRREVRRILRAGSGGRRTLVASHLTYLHSNAYPSLFDLSWAERRTVMWAPALTVQDRTLDWQDEDRVSDALKLQSWKLNFLQSVIQSEVEAARFLEDGGRLVIFSDHGHRRGLNELTFTNERYHRVLLMTFGLSSRCPKAPISLIDIGSLIGLSNQHAEPDVEFALADVEVWPLLMQTATLRWSGDVDLDKRLLGKAFARLQRHRPWPVADAATCQATVARASHKPGTE